MKLSENTASAFAILYRFPGLLESAVVFLLPTGKNEEMLLQLLTKDILECGFFFTQHFLPVSLC